MRIYLAGAASKEYTRKEMFDVVEKDLIHVATSDLILAEVGTLDYPYIGTSMEIRYAYEHGIPVVVWSPLEQNFFLEYHSTKIFKKLRDAIEYCIYFKSLWEGEKDEV